MQKNVLAIDCGGTLIKTGLVSSEGKILDQCSIPTDAGRGVEAVLRDLQKLIEKYRQQIVAVGVAYAGTVDPEKGIIFEPPNFPKDWWGLPIVNILTERTRIPVYLENDANLAALGEYWQGEGQGVDVLVVITLGTGVGGGIIIHGNIWNGATGIAGEIGHIMITDHGPRCGCGNIGCLETFASSTAVVRMAREMQGKSAGLACEDLTAEKVYLIAKGGDEAARSVFVTVGQALGNAIAVVAHILGPRKVILTGGGAGAWDLFHGEMQKRFLQRSFYKERETVQIVAAGSGDRSGLLGAAYMALRQSSTLA